MTRWKIAFPFLLVLGMTLLVIWSNVRGPKMNTDTVPIAGEVGDATPFDPICKMEVNPAWGFSHEHDGAMYYFCCDHCRETFAEDPNQYIIERCLVCESPIADTATALPATYMEKTYRLDSEECRAAFKADPAAYFMHRMWGIPSWLYYVSIGLILLMSFLMFEGKSLFARARHRSGDAGDVDNVDEKNELTHKPGTSILHNPSRAMGQLLAMVGPSGHSADSAVAISLPVIESPDASCGSACASDRVDLLRLPGLRALLVSRSFRFFMQMIITLMFIVIIAAGLFGNQNPALNIAPILTWTVWWCGLVVLIMFAGKAWCFMCPWDAIAGWTEKLRFWKKNDDGLGLNMKWPRWLRNVWLATFLFVGLTWVELGFGITMSPRATAYMAIAMLVMAIVCAFLYDRKSFCRYGCLVGRVSGLYAMFSNVEVRAKDAEVCDQCHTKECIKGSDTAYACPTFEYPAKMEVNTYCIQCGECLQSCPHDNMTVNMRPWGSDLAAQSKPRSDEAYLALLMLAISGFHGLTMTPVWPQMTGAIEASVPLGNIVSFTMGMAALLIGPILVYTVLVWLSYRIAVSTKDDIASRSSFRDYFIRYAYCVLPIALFYHLAHNFEHLLMEGPKVLAMLSDPFGWNWNLFGTATWRVPPLVSLDVLWILQVILVAVGHIYSLWAAKKISRGVFGDSVAASRSQWPLLIGMIAFSVFSLWLLKQPMEMRTSAM